MKQLPPEILEQLRQLDSCSVANAIETFHVRLRNKGFTDTKYPLHLRRFSADGGLCGHGSRANFRATHGRA